VADSLSPILSFFHFCGFEPEANESLDYHQPEINTFEPLIDMSNNAALSTGFNSSSTSRNQSTSGTPPGSDAPPGSPGLTSAAEPEPAPVPAPTRLDYGDIIERFVSSFRGTLPYHGTIGAPYFSGTNVTDFLKTWDILTYDHHVDDQQARERILMYISPRIREMVEALPEYCANNPGRYNKQRFYTALKREYRDQDWESIKNSQEYLHRIVSQYMHGKIPLKEYVILYDRASGNLEANNVIDEIYRCRLFLQGLPEWVRKQIIKVVKFDPKNVSTYKYAPMLEEATKAYAFQDRQRLLNEVLDPNHGKTIENHLEQVDLIQQPVDWNALPNPPEITLPNLMQPAIPVTVVNPPNMTIQHPTKNTATQKTPTVKTTRSQVHWEDQKPTNVDELSKAFEKLSVRQVQMADEIKDLFSEFSSGLKTQISEQIERASRTDGNRGNSGRGGFNGGGFGRQGRGGFSSQPNRSQYSDNPGSSSISQGPLQTGEMAARSVGLEYTGGFEDDDGTLDVDAIQGNYDDRRCYACDGRDWIGKANGLKSHVSSVCPYLIECINRGCLYKSPEEGHYYVGTYTPGKLGERIFWQKDRRWIDQILQRTAGTQWDFHHERRPGNIARREEDARLATQEQEKGTGNHSFTPIEVLRNDERNQEKRPFNADLGSLTGPDGWTLDSVYHFDANAVVQTRQKKTQEKQDSGAQRLWEKRKKEARLPQVRGSKSRASDLLDPMNVDESEVEEVIRETQTQVDDPGNMSEAQAARIRRKSSNVPGPSVPTQTKRIIQVMKTPNPAATLEVQLNQDFQGLAVVCEMAHVVERKLLSMVNPPKEFRAAIADIKERKERKKGRRLPSSLEQDSETDLELSDTFEVNRATIFKDDVDVFRLQKTGKIARSPRVWFSVMGTKQTAGFEAVIDTGAEINVMATADARKLGGEQFRVRNYKLSTASGHLFDFDGYMEFRVIMAQDVYRTIGFFLFRKAPKMLVGMNFLTKFKMGWQYNADGSIDGIFRDVKRKQQATIEIIPALPANMKPPRVGAKVYRRPTVKDEYSSEENERSADESSAESSFSSLV